MAAHPFGPIENQLIVGYYKRGFSPCRLRPTLQSSQTIRVFDGKTEPSNLLHQPVFYGWSPANGNSSSHDFRVSWNLHKPDDPTDLFSRGLGYRITFTMPEQEIRTEDPNLCPKGFLEILDLFGGVLTDKIELRMTEYLGDAPGNRPLPKQDLLELLSRYRTLQYQMTHLGCKIVENGTEVFEFPVYSPPGSSIDERHLAAAERHRVMLGYCRNSHSKFDKTFTDLSLDHLEQTLALLERELPNLSASHKQHIRNDVQAAATILARFCRLLTQGQESEINNNKLLLTRSANNLESDIRKWLDDEGPFPRYISIYLIKCSWQNSLALRRDLYHRPEQIFDALGIFYPVRLFKFIVDNVRSVPVGQLAVSQEPICFETKNFTICRGEKVYRFFNTAKGAKSSVDLLDPDAKPLKKDFRLLRETDCVLCYFKFSWYIIDLEAVFSRGGIDMTKKPEDRYYRICPSQTRFYWKLQANPRSSLLISSQNFWRKSVELFMYPLQESRPFEPKTWLKLAMKVTGRIHFNENQVPVERFTSHVSRCQTRIYLGSVQENPGAEVWLAFLTRNQLTETLTLNRQDSFSADPAGSQRLVLQWLASVETRVFACAFTPDCRLWAFMYWKGRFVRAGSNHNKRTLFRQFTSQFAGMMQEFDNNDPLSVLAYRSLGMQADGRVLYRFGRIAFTCK